MVVVAWLAWGVINSARLHAILEIDWPTAFWYGLPDALIWAGLTPVVVQLTRYSARSGRRFRHSLPFHVAASVLLALAHSVLDTSLNAVRGLLTGESPPIAGLLKTILTHAFHLNVLLYFLVAGFTYYLLSLRRLARRERHAAELRAELTQAQLLRLQSQLRPHFLFNALHTISAHMVSDPALGQRLVSRLGDLLRMSLNTGDRQTVPLAEELQFVEAYLDVERVRFGDKLTVVTEVDDSLLAFQVPALLLQPLVENAVHHGVSLNPDGGCVTIRATREDAALRLTVCDDGPGLAVSTAPEEHTGLGLANARARLDALYGDGCGLTIEPREPRGVVVTVRLPATAESAT